MSSGSGLAAASLLLTYVLRTSAAYAILSLFSCCLRNCRVRSRLNGLFLAAAAASWLCILVSSALPAIRPGGRIVSGLVSSRQFSWLVDSATLPQLTKGLTLALWLYAVILAVLLARFCGQSWQLRNLLRGSEPPPSGLALLFEWVRSGTGSPGCELRLLDDLRSPATTGWRTRFVLIPRDLVPRLDRKQLENVFQHELTHVRRRDYLWDRLSTFACYLIFFHPAAWWARRGLRSERELVE
jgi:Zn-dependent protease with chaperone function